jgi:hypothetical protein
VNAGNQRNNCRFRKSIMRQQLFDRNRRQRIPAVMLRHVIGAAAATGSASPANSQCRDRTKS